MQGMVLVILHFRSHKFVDKLKNRPVPLVCHVEDPEKFATQYPAGYISITQITRYPRHTVGRNANLLAPILLVYGWKLALKLILFFKKSFWKTALDARKKEKFLQSRKSHRHVTCWILYPKQFSSTPKKWNLSEQSLQCRQSDIRWKFYSNAKKRCF